MKKIMRQIVFAVFVSFLFLTTQNSFAGNEVTKINGLISNYSIVGTNYEKNSKKIEVFYPQISGLQDKTKQTKMNKIIKDTALIDMKEDIAVYDWYDLHYTVMWSSNNLLSIQFTGNYYDKTAPHPNNIFYTVNIDMNTGNRITLPDFINAADDFIKLFNNKAQFLADPIYLTADELSEVKEEWNSTFAHDLKYDFDEDAKFYFTSTGVVFSIYTSHAIGDYSLFSLKYSELSKYIKQNTVWKNIKTDFPATDYQILREQCFKTNLAAFGDTWFVSGFTNSLNGVKKGLQFYLIDQSGKVKYMLPSLFSNKLGYWDITAVAFRDVNHDGKKDVIVITSVYYEDVEKAENEAGVYLCKNNRFIVDNKLNTYLNTKLKGKTVSEVLKATEKYYKQ